MGSRTPAAVRVDAVLHLLFLVMVPDHCRVWMTPLRLLTRKKVSASCSPGAGRLAACRCVYGGWVLSGAVSGRSRKDRLLTASHVHV